MTEKEYREHPAISRSQLWKMSESPEKFLYAIQNTEEPAPSLLFGQIVHKLVLQNEDFASEYAVWNPEVDRRTKEGKEQWIKFQEESEGKQIININDFWSATYMANTVFQNSFAKKLLAGEHEVPFFWADEMTGSECKCRCDCLTEIGDQLYIVDYKSTTDASERAFQRDVFKFGYAFQAAMYSEGVKVNTGRTPKFVFIAQEKTAPYSINIFETDDAVVTYGYDQFRQFIGMYKDCMETGNFYGYLGRENVVNTLMLPPYLAEKE